MPGGDVLLNGFHEVIQGACLVINHPGNPMMVFYNDNQFGVNPSPFKLSIQPDKVMMVWMLIWNGCTVRLTGLFITMS